MTYATGQLILHDEYNTFAQGGANGVNHAVANINTIWGTGSGDKGYGQATPLTAVAAGDTITATQWSTLVARLNSILLHESGVGYTISNGPSPIVAGGIVTAITNLSASISTAFTNRANYVANGSDTTATTVTSATWATRTTHTITATFDTYDKARYFFNGGGVLRFTPSHATGSGAGKDLDWTTLCTACGTIVVAANGTTKSGGSGSTSILTTTTGFHQFSTTPVVIFKQLSPNSPYSTNYVQITATGNSATPNVITFAVLYEDASTSPPSDEVVTGNITTTHTIRPPETTYLTNSWGTPTLPTGTVATV